MADQYQRRALSDPSAEEHAQALVAARSAHEMVERLTLALREERAISEQLRRDVERLEPELQALRATRLFRYTTGLRRVYGRRLDRQDSRRTVGDVDR